MEDIEEQDEDDLFKNGGDDVEMSDDDDLMCGCDDFASVVRDACMENYSVATYVILNDGLVRNEDTRGGYQTLTAAKVNGTALAVTPQKPNSSISHAKYPEVLTDSQIKTLRSNINVCSGITAAKGRMVSHIPSNTPLKQSAASYDKRLQREM